MNSSIQEQLAERKRERREFGRSRLAQFGKTFTVSQYVNLLRTGSAFAPFACARHTAKRRVRLRLFACTHTPITVECYIAGMCVYNIYNTIIVSNSS